MLIKLAWRNIWRNKVRSLVVILAIMAGTWSVIILTAFTNGFVESYINNVIDKEIGHIQLHDPKYENDPSLQHSIQNPAKITADILKIPQVEGASYRILVNGMVSTGHGVRGVKAIGIIAKNENRVFRYDKMIVEGSNVDTGSRHPVLLSRSLAKELKVGVGKKIVLTFQDDTGNMASGAYRISGLFNTNNKNFDNSHVYLKYTDLENLAGIKNEAQEIVIKCHSDQQVSPTRDLLIHKYPDLEVLDYNALAPEITLFRSQIKMSNYLYMIIFMLALIFGIINTMLMAVLERIKELGMLMAIGLNKKLTFFMIVLETLFLAIIASPIGMFLAKVTIQGFQKTGLDLSRWSKGLTQFGMDSTLYPFIQNSIYWEVALAVCFTALLASLYPALKAIKLRPVEAIRKI